MKKKILYLTVAVVIVLLGASAATAIVSPPPGIKDTNLKSVWAAIMDLQKQITNIPMGQACWDLNNNGQCDKTQEDKNGDAACNVLDCQGPKGDTGATGATGEQGPAGPAGGSMVLVTSGLIGERIPYPTGFTESQCSIFPHEIYHVEYDKDWTGLGYDHIVSRVSASKNSDGFLLIWEFLGCNKDTPSGYRCVDVTPYSKPLLVEYIIVCNA